MTPMTPSRAQKILGAAALGLLACQPPGSAASGAVASSAAHLTTAADQAELETAIVVSYRADAGVARDLMLSFLGAPSTEAVRYQLTLRSESGALLRSFAGTVTGGEGLRTVTVRWDGRDSSGRVVPAGHYSLQLSSQAGGLADEQEHTIQVGTVSTPRLASFAGLPVGTTAEALAPAAGGLPYTVYLGTLHSQTNHSDGGVPVSSCDGAEVPQRGALGPSAAYEMARAQAGLDFLLTTDHNHMFDGSTGVNSAADSAAANRLFASGVSEAIAYSRSHPGFVAAYGSEWGVISSGGHIGLVNPPALINWEHNGKGELIGSLEIAKNDYAALYDLMKQKGVMGQFNHPRTGQFGIGGSAFAYDSNGDAVMVLAEVANSSSFSKNITESETSVPSFEAGWKRLLEAGYHVAPSSDQDNHCANWGLALHNRTGILVPTGTPLTYGSLLSALRARRVFATLDKTAQIILTADGHVMGERYVSTGPVHLHVQYASSAGHAASRVEVYQGEPGKVGSTLKLKDGDGDITLTPAKGQHYYFAIITQTSGDKLWSAPLWVEQR